MPQLHAPAVSHDAPTARYPRHRPLVPVVIGIGVAIIIADRTADQLAWGSAISLALAGVCGGIGLWWGALRGSLFWTACVLPLGYAYTLWSAVWLPEDHISRHLVSTPVMLEGRLLRVVEGSGGKATLDVAALALGDNTATKPVSGWVRVTVYAFQPLVQDGDIIRVHGVRLRSPSGFRNPGAFDYGRYLARRGIHATGSISKGERIELVYRPPAGPLTRLSLFKADLVGYITRGMGEPEAAITKTMVLGVPAALPPEVNEAFVASGTAHLMSVSGVHVGFIYAAILFVLKPLLRSVRFRLLGQFSGGPRPSKLAAACGLVVVVGYACLVGPNFPTIRSTLMIATYVVAYLFDRDGDPFQTTALAALLILMFYPLALFDIGFQLSFAGVLAILYANRLLHPPGESDVDKAGTVSLAARVKEKVRDAAFISAFASLGTAPLVLYYFQRVPLIAPLANIVVIPVASPSVPLGLLAPFVAQIVQPLGDALLYLTCVNVRLVFALVRLFAGIPYAAPRIGPMPLPVVILAYGSLLLCPHMRTNRLAHWGAIGGMVLVGLLMAWPWAFREGRGQLQVTFLDVGQGEATFIRFPGGTTMLIDGGGSYRDDFDVGERVVAPFLWYERVLRIDYVVASHPHPDHAKGLLFILRNFRVQEFWDNGSSLQSSWYRMLREEAIRGGIYRDVVAEGLTAADIDGVRLELLHPTTTFQAQAARRLRADEDRAENNHSLVLKLEYGNASFLFPGDIEAEAELFLVQTSRDLQADVLKAPHHGSRTSSGDIFLGAVNPGAVVFSVQRNNRFGHPAPAVLDRYEAAGAGIFRTDHDGAITIRTDGQSLWAETYSGWRTSVPVQTKRPQLNAFTP